MSQKEDHEQLSRTGRLDRWIRRSPPVLIIGLLLFLVATVTAAAGHVWTLRDWYEDRYRWREQEYSKLLQLHSDITLERFEEVLGAAWFRKSSGNGRWVEYTFRGRDYWVQAVTRRRSPSVSLYAVTSCSDSFTPTFRFPDATPITLSRATLASVRPNADAFPVYADYRVRVNTANMWIMERQYGGNPGNYKGVQWGFNDVCELAPVLRVGEIDAAARVEDPSFRVLRPVTKLPSQLRSLRERAVVNTYAEWGPTEYFPEGVPFQVGVNRILIRTIVDPYYEPG